ncbi:solute carrier family 47 member 4 [Lampris incognitus]|uniref:solute carrier family 47 member 4 n=1 Tax=Lampris incognitus TaxID=2546036 RepID=UPI0024B53E7E|nr:solute carrier family 47 member 4 [Lampris incognitus]
MEETGAKLFRRLRRSVPRTHRQELRHIVRMTGPLLLSRFLQYLLPFVVTIFCGRLGNEVMAGYGLASATINVTTIATGIGLAMACDTLVSQTFGGKNLLRVGVILQRGVLILLLFCLPCWSLLINAQAILLSLGQNPEVARIAQLYITAFLPAVPAIFLYQLQVSYLQNQGIILPQMYAAALANIANVVTNYILIHWMDLGVNGSAAANTLSQIYICCALFGFIWWRRLHVRTWGGWSRESLQDWGSYMRLAIPSALMICFEWWVYELGGFLAGMLSENELAAQHAVIMMAYITYMFPIGVQVAACVRVGNALGAGDTAGAILASRVSLALAGGMAVVLGLVLVSTKTVIGFIFTSDEHIVSLVSYLMNVHCVLHFFESMVCVCVGILLGAGKQKIAAVANLIGYYCVGLPLAITLMFVAKLRILGFWLGLIICVCIQSTSYVTVILKLDWDRITEEAVKRARKNSCAASQRDAAGLSGLVGDDAPEQIAGGGNSANNHTSGTEEGQDGGSGSPYEHAVQQTGGELSRGPLSPTQLILRRGTTTFALLAVLAVGISVHLLLPLPQTFLSGGNRTTDWINTTHAPDLVQPTVPNSE